MDISTVPPILLPAYRGEFVYNTECAKDTRFKELLIHFYIRFLFVRFGSQQLLMNLIANKKLDMKELNSFSLDKLKSVMLSAGFEKCDINQLSYSKKYY